MALIEYPALAAAAWRYRDSEAHVPYRVRLTLKPGSPLGGYDPVALDGLLARAVVEEVTGCLGLPDASPGYVLPLPLRCLGRYGPHAAPLWAATPLVPEGVCVTDVLYWHKRAQSGRWTGTKTGEFSIRSTNGRWMERRVPLPVTQCREWTADAVGDPEEAARLLGRLAFVGKRRGMGLGEVERWEVLPLPEFRLVASNRLRRSVPVLAGGLLGGALPAEAPALVGWTPPAWKPDLFLPGWWAGTALPLPEIDWYAEVPCR